MIVIGDDIRVTVVSVRDGKVKIGVEAPAAVSVHREEIWQEIQREKRRPAEPESPAKTA